MELGELFDKYGTDKVRCGYHDTYEILLQAHRHSVSCVLEVGIGTLDPAAPSSMVGYAAGHYAPGGSLRAWRDYFPNAVVWGLDTQPDTQFEEPRIVTRLADSTDKAQVDAALPEGLCFDLIVDDGDHTGRSQIDTLRNLWARVKPGGIYVIEDICSEEAVFAIGIFVGGLEGRPVETLGPARNLMVIPR